VTCSFWPGHRCGTPAAAKRSPPPPSASWLPAFLWQRSAAPTAGLARAGLLNERNHTSAAAGYLAASSYAGGERYIDQRAVVDGDLITAGPQSPVQFARATLARLGLASDRTLEAYEAVLHRGDTSAFPELMAARGVS
jgi:hypothetical protein